MINIFVRISRFSLTVFVMPSVNRVNLISPSSCSHSGNNANINLNAEECRSPLLKEADNCRSLGLSPIVLAIPIISTPDVLYKISNICRSLLTQKMEDVTAICIVKLSRSRGRVTKENVFEDLHYFQNYL